MGNHEFNAIAFHTRKPGSKGFFRERNVKNQDQHQATLNQLSSDRMRDALEWFKTLPVALELDGLRVVHAAWQPRDIKEIGSGLKSFGRFTADFLVCALDRTNSLFHAIENVLKGPESQLPEGKSFLDKDGHRHTKVRVRWYADPTNLTLREYAFGASELLPDEPAPSKDEVGIKPYPEQDPPVFFGHYWLQGDPDQLGKNVACIDYSVAKNGKLCAYQWSPGEKTLSADRYVWVDATKRVGQ